MAALAVIDNWRKVNSLTISIVLNICLALLCILSYVAIVLLFLTEGLGFDTFQYVGGGRIQPTIAIQLLGALLMGCTSALLTKAVEHDVWITIDHYHTFGERTEMAEELHGQALWSVSALSRLTYAFVGRHWLLRLSGLLLFGMIGLTPVLLYGIKPEIDVKSTTVKVPRENGWFYGVQEVVPFNSLLAMAAFASGNNLSVPASDVCLHSDCFARIQATALRTVCTSQSEPFAWCRGEADCSSVNGDVDVTAVPANVTACSSIGSSVCATITSEAFQNAPANFTTGEIDVCFPEHNTKRAGAPAILQCPTGTLGVIFGLWVGRQSSGRNDTFFVNAVDCRVEYGNITITQNGNNTPELVPGSFTISPTNLLLFPLNVTTSTDNLRLAFSLLGAVNMPYDFTSDDLGQAGVSLYEQLLVVSEPEANNAYGPGPSLNSNASQVADIIGRNFEMASMIAFVKAPRAAISEVTSTTRTTIWSYNRMVLAILAVPLLPTILVLCKRWKLANDDVMIGYDPMRIAERSSDILGLQEKRLSGESDDVHGHVTMKKGRYNVYTRVDN